MPAPTNDQVPLHHVIVVGGTAEEWAGTSDELWATRLGELGKVADHAGVRWLVLRPYGPAGVAPAGTGVRSLQVGNCLVLADPECDGRRRLTQAVAALQSEGVAITEASIGARLQAPADADPDLVVVLAPTHRMPPSLVWELAYSELVFVDASWLHFAAGQLDEAMAAFAQRHRRFGGVD